MGTQTIIPGVNTQTHSWPALFLVLFACSFLQPTAHGSLSSVFPSSVSVSG